MSPQILMAAWLAAVVIASWLIAVGVIKVPFVLALDRAQQRQMSFWFGLFAAGEIFTLWLGGFWSN